MDFIDQYRIQRPSYEILATRLQDLLHYLAKANKIEVHTIESRAKTLESFSEKVSRPGKTYQNPLEDITDLCGLRVILYYQEDVHHLAKLIREEFNVDDKRSGDKRDELRSDQFGYISVHLICQLGDNRNNLPEWRDYRDLRAEIQVRTVLQHAWASISHALQYKNKSDIPEQFMRQMTRIAGLLELSDEQFSSLREKTSTLRSEVGKSLASSNLQVTINSVALEQFLETSELAIEIENYSRDAGNTIMQTFTTNQLLSTCRAFEILKLSELSAILGAFIPHAREFFEAFKILQGEDNSGDRDHWVAMAVVAMKGGSGKEQFILEEGHWHEGYLKDTLQAAMQAKIKPEQ
ncbi:GTP pyrophosphokinase family protein [Delftia sp. WSY_9]|uniref:GTP pyrophosphokinase n=1 Tax=Delftia TaxID=80865 RepID=UPI0032DE986B